MSVQILEKNGKPAFAILPYEEYERLLAAIEDAGDAVALLRFAERLEAGEEERIPAAVVDRLLGGQNPLRVWREHRGLSAAKLAEAVGVTPAHISKLESGQGDPSVALLARLAAALGVSMDDLAGAQPA